MKTLDISRVFRPEYFEMNISIVHLGGILLISILLFGNYYFISKRILNWLNLIFAAQGVSIMLMYSYMPEYYGFVMLLVSVYFLFKNSQFDKDINIYNYSGKNFIDFMGKNNSFVYPFIGISILLCSSFYNYYFDSAGKWFGNLDVVAYLAGIFWILFNMISDDFKYERNFILSFLTILLIILFLPLLLGLTDVGDNEKLIELILVKPLANLLALFGFEAAPAGKMLYYYDINHDSHKIMVEKSCSGYFSIICFVAAYASFLFNESGGKTTTRFLFLLLGVLTAFMANLFRMLLIMIVGIYYGDDALFWAHKSLGPIIFIFWMSVFFYILMSLIPFRQLDLKA